LKHDERVDLAIWPLLSEQGGTGAPTSVSAHPSYDYYAGGVPLYRSVLGPDGSGEISIDHKASLPVDHPSRVLVQAEVGEAHPNDCFDPGSRAGCVFLDLGDPGRPQLAVTAKPATTGPAAVRVRASATDIAGQTMFLSVFANGPGRGHQIMQADLTPDAAGNLLAKPTVRLPSSTHSICVIANTIVSQSCPPVTTPPKEVLDTCISQTVNKPPLGSDKPTTRTDAEKRCRASFPRLERRSTSWVRLRLP
jgi:hypothetical protein